MKEPTIYRLDGCVDGVVTTHLGAFVDGKFAATVELLCLKQDRSARRSATIRQLFVLSDFRRNRIGTALVNKCCDIAKEYGCKTLGLSLDGVNLIGRNFYSHLQFIEAYEYDDGSIVVAKTL